MLVRVSEQHIKCGQRKSCKYCPIALAFEEQIPRAIDILVMNFYRFCVDDIFYTGELPLKAKAFIFNFDNEFFVQPIEFEIPYNDFSNQITCDI